MATGDAVKAQGYIERARCRLKGVPHPDNAW
jgi:hypothetical protein